MEPKFWTAEELCDLYELYPTKDNKFLTNHFWRSKISIRNKAIRMWIRKTEEYLDSNNSKNLWDSRVRWWDRHHMFGKSHTEEAINKIKEKHFSITIDVQAQLHRKRKFPIWEDVVFYWLTDKWIKFEHQKPVWEYILDFFIPDFNIWIEVDGVDHKTKISMDRRKKEFVESKWISVRRVYNYYDIDYQLTELFQSL